MPAMRGSVVDVCECAQQQFVSHRKRRGYGGVLVLALAGIWVLILVDRSCRLDNPGQRDANTGGVEGVVLEGFWA